MTKLEMEKKVANRLIYAFVESAIKCPAIELDIPFS